MQTQMQWPKPQTIAVIQSQQNREALEQEVESQAVWDRQPCSVSTAQGWCAECIGIGSDRSACRSTHYRNPVSGLSLLGVILKAVGHHRRTSKREKGWHNQNVSLKDNWQSCEARRGQLGDLQ